MFPPVPDKQKALWLPKAQGQYTIGEADIPKPGPGEVLICEQAVGLNFVDHLVQKVGIFVKEYPVISGFEGAGVVIGVGEGVRDVSVGDRVFHPSIIGNAYGGFKQYSTIPADLVAKLPRNLSYDRAAAIPLAFNTAALGLYAPSAERGGAALTPFWEPEGLRKYAGQPILVLGGSSSVGQFAIQLAKLSGFSPIITTASLKHAEFLKGLGATHVLDRSLPAASIQSELGKITSEPFKVIYDAVSYEDTQNIGYDLLASGGTLIIDTSPKIAESKRSADKNIAFILADPTIPDRRKLTADLYKHVPAYFASEDLKPNHIEVLPNGLAGIPDGIERLAKGEVSGLKLIARPQETPA
ncbi:hypothetical protein EIP86_000562 [Pleurotus ostreatoroseus]|nr:hypothetical protein EIP86_000562 [Pleurotus ostreatoroseus]